MHSPAATAAPHPSLPRGTIDFPAAGSRHTGRAIAVSGWAYEPGRTVARVDVVHDGRRVRAGICRPRPDVAEAFGTPAALLSGFHADVDVPPAVSGLQRVGVDVTFIDGGCVALRPVECRIEVVAPPTAANGAPLVRHPPPRPGRPRREAEPARVLIVARSFDHGGSQLRMAELVAHLCATQRFDVTVLSPTDGPLAGELRHTGANAEVGPAVPFDDPRSYDAAVVDIAGWADGSFDVVCGYTMTSFHAVEVAHRIGVPSVVRVGETQHVRTVAAWLGNPMHPLVEERARRAFADADVVLFNSRAGIELQRRLGFEGRFAAVGNGVAVGSADAFARSETKAACRRALGIEPGRRLLVCAGTMWPVKAQAQLVEAFARVAPGHPRLECALVGLAPSPYVEALAAARDHHRLGDRVRLVPFRRDLRPWWRAADLGVCSSETEAMPAAVLEAMSFGLPVMATAVGGVPEVVHDGATGWLCEPSDLRSMIDALERVARTDEETVTEMGERARRVVRREHDRDELLTRMTDLLLSLARGDTPDRLGGAQGSRIVTATSSVSSAVPL